MSYSVVLGAPKIISLEPSKRPQLSAVRMDTCAFVGVAPKGPVRRPKLDEQHCFTLQELAQNWYSQARTLATLVSSWDEYVSLYGAFEGPGRLPYAVSQFFEQGGKQAYICRIVPDYSDAQEYEGYLAAVTLPALHQSSGPVRLTAKNEGSWANGMGVAVGFAFDNLLTLSGTNNLNIRLAHSDALDKGELIRLVNNDPDKPADNYATYRFVTHASLVGQVDSAARVQLIDLQHDPLPAAPNLVQLVHGQCVIEDKNKQVLEAFERLGFSPSHPRFLARVLFSESNVLDPLQEALSAECLPPDIDPYVSDFYEYQASQQLLTSPGILTGGEDRYQDIRHEDFFDPDWVAGNQEAGDGIHSLALLEDCGMLVIPDLYVPDVFEPTSSEQLEVPGGQAEFVPCVEFEAQDMDVELAHMGLPGLMLDPVLDLQAITHWQQQAAYFTELRQGMMLLLDVPPRLNQRQVMLWRSAFNSRVCAAYHPWLKVNRVNPYDVLADPLIAVNPSAVAAGIIAATELQSGLPYGPANRRLAAVTAMDTHVSDEQHNDFHPAGINVLQQQRDGIWMTGARTLSRDKQWRHISVVRMMQMLKKSLNQQMQWLVFESNHPGLWADVRFSLRTLLRQMYLGGAFKGETEQQAFFIRCDESTNPRQIIDAGQLVVLVGVALVEPLEFILLQITRQADGALSLEEQ